MSADEIIGIATCSYCQKRYRIQKKHERIVGKEIECPKCHRKFVVAIQSLSPLEQAAVAQAKEDSASKNGEAEAVRKRKRRKKSEITEGLCQRIRETLPGFLQRLRAIVDDEKSSEEHVRVWCIDVMRAALGHDDSDLAFEMHVLKNRIDVAVQHEGKVVLVVECKNARHKFAKNAARNQAVQYAISKSVDWAVVTSGPVWKLYRIIPVKGLDPQVVEVFDVALFDEDGLSDYDVGCLYLLTKRALLGGESEKVFHQQQAMEERRLFNALTSERGVSVLRKMLAESYKNEFDVNLKLTDDDVKEKLEEVLRPDSL